MTQINEQCPIDTGAAPWLWAHNKQILDELRAVVEPLVDELATYVEADIATSGDVVARETLTTRAQHGIPFGVPYTLLPPRLFSGLYDGVEAPRLPNDEFEARRLVVAYSQRHKEPPLEGMPEGSYTPTPEGRLGELLDDIVWMAERGVVIDPVTWERYRQAGREQAENGRYDLDMISVGRGNSIKSLYHYPALAQLVQTHATRTFEHFIAMPTAALDVDGQSFGLLPVGYLFMPSVAYSPQFSEKLLRTTVYMVNSGQVALPEKASEVAQAHPETVAKHITRSRDGRPHDASLVSLAQEGARSSMEVIALLMADRVSGYDDPDELLAAINQQGIIEEFTRAVPMGLVGPLLFTGKYFPNLLLHEGGGKLILNPSIMNEIKQAKRALAQQDMAEWALYWAASEEDQQDTMPPVATGLVCPAAMPHGALRQMNALFLKAYKMINF